MLLIFKGKPMFKIIKKSKDYKQYYANIIVFRKEPKKVIRSSRMN